MSPRSPLPNRHVTEARLLDKVRNPKIDPPSKYAPSITPELDRVVYLGPMARAILEPLLPAESTVSLPTLTTSRPRSGTCTR